MSNAEKDLRDKIREWLSSEGYPLEFRTAREFVKCGFSARQGSHIRHSDSIPREVDVLAHLTDGKECVRVYHVVECKWSADKPWVIFTSEMHQMATSACANQTIGSLLGRSIIWILAGDPEVTELRLFECPARGGFGGRQAFSKGNDLFYSAVQSVVSKADSLVKEYDDRRDPHTGLPEWGVVAFPLIVVEGDLFEGYMDWVSGEITVQPTNHVRIHWTGSESWSHHASVAIVTESHVSAFAAVRAHETNVLLKKMRLARANIEACWASDSLETLDFRPAARGTRGLPSILREILLKARKKQASQPRLGPAVPERSAPDPGSTEEGAKDS